MLQLQPSQPPSIGIPTLGFLHSHFPFVLHLFITKRSKAHTPTFKDDDFYCLLVGFVHHWPLLLRSAITSSIELGLVIARNLDVWSTLCQGVEKFYASSYIMCGRHPAVLNERVRWVRLSESLLLVVREVEVIYGED